VQEFELQSGHNASLLLAFLHASCPHMQACTQHHPPHSATHSVPQRSLPGHGGHVLEVCAWVGPQLEAQRDAQVLLNGVGHQVRLAGLRGGQAGVGRRSFGAAGQMAGRSWSQLHPFSGRS